MAVLKVDALIEKIESILKETVPLDAKRIAKALASLTKGQAENVATLLRTDVCPCLYEKFGQMRKVERSHEKGTGANDRLTLYLYGHVVCAWLADMIAEAAKTLPATRE